MLIACGLSSEQKTSADGAMSALRKLESSAQVGVSYMNYGPLLIEARAKVNEASAKLPDGDLKKDLIEAMNAYERAGAVWTETLRWGDYALDDVSRVLSDADREKYSLSLGAVSRSQAMSAMWRSGSNHINHASQLLEK